LKKNEKTPVRRQNANRQNRRTSTAPTLQKKKNQKVIQKRSGLKAAGFRSGFNTGRVSGQAKPNPTGTTIVVSNLKFDVLEDELQSLFGSVGKIENIEVSYDRSGRSMGNAKLTFAKRNDAIKAVEEFNNRTIDDLPMEVKLLGQNGKNRSFSNENLENATTSTQKKNVRDGLFGTSLQTNKRTGRNFRKNNDQRNTTFTVVLSGLKKGSRANAGRNVVRMDT